MKSFSYNPTVALSILLAAVFLEKYPEAKVNETESKGTDFYSKLSESEQNNSLLSLLKDEKDDERSQAIQLGILSDYHDITKFENQFELLKIYKGDSNRLDKLVGRGTVVKNFVNSPAFSSAAAKAFFSTPESDTDDFDSDEETEENIENIDASKSTDVK